MHSKKDIYLHIIAEKGKEALSIDVSSMKTTVIMSMITKIMTLSTQKDGTLVGKTSLITAMKTDGITGHFSALAIVMNNVMP